MSDEPFAPPPKCELSALDMPALFRRALDGDLSAEEFQQLENRLQADALLRAEYVKFVDLEACLHDELQQRSEPVVVPLPARPRSWPRWLALSATAAACLFVVMANWMRSDVEVVQNPPVTGNQTLKLAQPAFLTAPLQGLPDVAVVTASDQPVTAELAVGARLKPGVLTLSEGELQLDFLGGGRLLLRGPAELHLVSATAATLVSGAACVRMPYSQAGFMLNAPEAAVIAAGTEFAARVQPDRRTLVQVYGGAAEISLLGEDGSTLISQRLTDRSAVLVDAATRQFLPVAEPFDDLPRVRELDHAELVVTADYVRQVEQSRPYLYWRFESVENGRIPDALDGPYAAQILSDDFSRDAIRIANGVAEFLPSVTPRCIASVDLVPDFNRRDFSIELWMLPTELKASAIFSTVLPGELPSPRHLNFLEIAFNTNLVHQPGVIRFLHRQPPAIAGGYNLFSQDVCTPGVWSHIVATKSTDELRLFVNGQLIRTVSGPGTGASDDLSYRLVLGQLGTLNNQRQFQGMIDEVAVYNRALRSEEISRHYWSIVRSVPLASWRPVDEDESLITWRGR